MEMKSDGEIDELYISFAFFFFWNQKICLISAIFQFQFNSISNSNNLQAENSMHNLKNDLSFFNSTCDNLFKNVDFI